MQNLVIGISFVAMVLAPCVVTIFSCKEQEDSE